MRRSILLMAVVGLLVATMAMPAFAEGKGRAFSELKVYVTGQELVYDTIVPVGPDQGLPFNGKGNWQLLEMTGPTGLQTEFGPGDTGYFGGRWYIEVDGEHGPTEGDVFFLCPLLGPGYELHY